ncbi:multiple sugar transport system substrate-binding protein [Nonomuraea solani]|uniref:Multiple sugar transport system substrate-binding protein n=1 Tax=Nonomuraea solani TaxID=1144553 RepID=A0A1H6E4L9_9ACTN|nr:extracellular solute-binding protein [Nonomuraea solani]SEG91954.1 multiple sugar transport system substrate-binding protein [Nonomuraea solani]
MTDRSGIGLSRRDLVRMAGLTGLGLGLTACGRGFGGGGDAPTGGGVRLNMVWWGDATRAQKTQAALDVFQRKNPGITVKTEYQDSGPYKDKLATRFAAGDPPDLMMMRMDSLREYADRGALLDLNQHKGAVDVTGLSESVLGLAAVGDKNFGIASGLNSIGFVVNKTLTEKYGVKIPDGDTWSWKDLAAFAKEISDASGKKVYGTGFEPATLANLIVYTRQRGEDFYTADGKLGISEATVVAWFEMVEKMRAEGGFPPAGFFENIGGSAEQSYLAKGTLASQIIPTNNFLGYNAAAGGNLALLRIPGETTEKRRGQSIDTPALWSVAARSKHPAETLKLLDFLINDPDASKATGTTRGVPANAKVAAEVKPSLPPDDQVATDYLAGLQKEELPRAYTYPPGSSGIAGSLETIATEVEFKRQTPQQGAKAFLEAGAKALGG